jgi:ABC-type multidrug transport system fused ATPase/permease subunit
MIKKVLIKAKTIINVYITAPNVKIIIFSNFISSFLSVVGIPLLVVAFKYSKDLGNDSIPFYKTISDIFNFIGLEMSFYSLIGLAFFIIIIAQTGSNIVELLNRYVHLKVVKKFSIDLIKNFKNASWLSILEDKSGKFQFATNTESQSAANFVLDSLRFGSCIVQIIFFLSTSFYYSPKITTILFFFFIFLGIITAIGSAKISLLANSFNLERVRIAESVSNINNNKKYLKASSYTNFFKKIYENIQYAWGIDWKLHLYSLLLRYIVFIFLLIFILLLLIFYKKIGTNIEEVSIAILIFLRTIPVFIKISESYSSLNETMPVYENLTKRLIFFKNQREKNGNLLFKKQDIISFNNVFYKYPSNKKYSIINLNLKIKPNKTHVIIGPSGSGKSTVVDLLMGLLRPSKGHIKYGDVDQKKLNLQSFRKKVSYISQNISLFDGTVKENLLMGENKTNKQIVDACKLCFAFKFINSMPKKFNTQIGENAIKISGGQKQRILLARALLANSEIIILDEATNQLDKKAIDFISHTIKKIKKIKTIIIISHQKDVEKLADKVFFLKNK